MLFDYFVQLDKDKDNKVRQRQPYLAELRDRFLSHMRQLGLSFRLCIHADKSVRGAGGVQEQVPQATHEQH